jgi:hypothetical protein
MHKMVYDMCGFVLHERIKWIFENFMTIKYVDIYVVGKMRRKNDASKIFKYKIS